MYPFLSSVFLLLVFMYNGLNVDLNVFMDFGAQLRLASHGRWCVRVWSIRRCSGLAEVVLGTAQFGDYAYVWVKCAFGVVPFCFALVEKPTERLTGLYICVCSLILRVRHHSADSVSHGLGAASWLGLICIHVFFICGSGGGHTPLGRRILCELMRSHAVCIVW